MKRTALAQAAPPVATFVIGVALAELVIRALDVSPLILPRPSAVFAAATSEAGPLLAALGATTRAVLAGLLLSSTVGVAAAVALARRPGCSAPSIPTRSSSRSCRSWRSRRCW